MSGAEAGEVQMDRNATQTAPELLYDEDGVLMGVRKDKARSAAQALRIALCEQDWLLDDVPGHWTEDEEDFIYDRGWFWMVAHEIKLTAWHSAQGAEAEVGGFGPSGWWRDSKDGYEVCYGCDGTGDTVETIPMGLFVHRPCPECGGVGRLPVWTTEYGEPIRGERAQYWELPFAG